MNSVAQYLFNLNVRRIDRLRRIRRGLHGLIVKDGLDTSPPTKTFGEGYCKWTLVPSGLSETSVVYSFGVGTDATFDMALIEAYGLVIHAFDPTPKSIAWAHEQGLPGTFILHEHGLADFDGETTFNPPDNPDYVSHTMLNRQSARGGAIVVPMKRLASIMRELGHKRIDVLKMDIEGAEFAAIDDMLAGDIRPGQILAEFHKDYPGTGVFRVRRAIASLRTAGYLLFSVAGDGWDLSFVHSSQLNGAQGNAAH